MQAYIEALAFIKPLINTPMLPTLTALSATQSHDYFSNAIPAMIAHAPLAMHTTALWYCITSSMLMHTHHALPPTPTPAAISMHPPCYLVSIALLILLCP